MTILKALICRILGHKFTDCFIPDPIKNSIKFTGRVCKRCDMFEITRQL